MLDLPCTETLILAPEQKAGNMNMIELGKSLKFRREFLGITLDHLSAKTGVGEAELQEIEDGTLNPPGGNLDLHCLGVWDEAYRTGEMIIGKTSLTIRNNSGTLRNDGYPVKDFAYQHFFPKLEIFFGGLGPFMTIDKISYLIVFLILLMHFHVPA